MKSIPNEKLAELALAHPTKRLKVIEYTFDDELFELVATIPTRTQLQRSLAESKVSDEQGAAAIALDCIVYPADVDTLLEERYLAMMSVAKELLRLGGAGAEARQKKPQSASSKRG